MRVRAEGKVIKVSEREIEHIVKYSNSAEEFIVCVYETLFDWDRKVPISYDQYGMSDKLSKRLLNAFIDKLHEMNKSEVVEEVLMLWIDKGPTVQKEIGGDEIIIF